jgi:hypothetical protein
MRIRTLLLIALFGALCVLPAAASAATKTETANLGPVSVTLTYDTGPSPYDVSNTRIAIARGAVPVFNQAVADPCKQCAVVPAGLNGSGGSLTIRDLDGDGEPEVLFDIYTGGAHCCSYTWIYRYTGSTYSGVVATWGDTGYSIVQLPGHAGPLLRTYDDRFAYEFTDFADSAFPPTIFSYNAGHLLDITRSFPSVIKADATRQLRLYKRAHRRRDIRGVVAAYAADEYLLGKPSAGLHLAYLALRRGELDGLGRGDVWARGRAYISALKKFLRHNGYGR